jgi:hypothetical protein
MPPTSWRASAFGVDLRGSFDSPLLPALAGAAIEGATLVELVDRETVDAAWGSPAARRVGTIHDPDGAELFTTDYAPEIGFRVEADGFGVHLVAPDGTSIICAPPHDAEPWHWQRLLVAQILPLAAALRGAEVLHASGVVVDGRALVFAGPCGAGKTTVALELMLRGAGFMADDVVALKIHEGRVMAYPGAAMTGIRMSEEALVSREADADGLGATLGEGGKAYRSVATQTEAAPLGGLYFLDRGADTDTIEFVRRLPPDPRELLAATFLPALNVPARLRVQLEVQAMLAREVPVFSVRVPRNVDARALAAAVERQARAAGVADESR